MNSGAVSKFAVGILPITIIISSAYAQENSGGQVIKLNGVDNLLGSVLKTLQFYFPIVAAVVIAFLGFKLMTSGDDRSAKAETKRWFINIVIGSILVYGE